MAHNTLQTVGITRRLTNSPVIARLQAQTDIEKARLGRVAALQVFRIQTVGCVTRKALFEVSFITQYEQEAALLVPLATSRLQAISEVGILGLAEIVHETVNEVTA